MNNKPLVSNIVMIFAIAALVLSAVAFSKSRQEGGNDRQDSLAKIQQTKLMKVCYAVWEPAVMKDPKTGKLSGHDIDFMEVLAQQVGANIEYHETTFGNMAAALQSGVCDIGTDFFINAPRSAAVAFTKPVFYAGNSGLARKGDTRFKTINDVDKPGIKVAVATGEAGHIYAKNNFKNAQIIPIDVESSDISKFLLEVESGRADIGLASAQTIKLFAEAHPNTEDVFANQVFDINPVAFPVRHNDTAFRDFVNNVLLYLETSGQWDKFEKKHNAHWLHEVKEYRVQ